MHLATPGVPIHTRALSVALHQAAPGVVSFRGYVLDLRKRGFVPVAGDLQGTGIIHHMEVSGEIDDGARTIRTIEATMPSVAFEASAATGGESCRDPVRAVAGLAGSALAPGFARRVGAEIGGPRGCSHILTLLQLLGPTAAWALDEDGLLNGGRAERRPDERIFRRDVVIDGTATDEGDLHLGLQLSDLHTRPGPPVVLAPDRFAGQLEIRVAARMTIAELRIGEVEVTERRRTAADFETATWVARPDIAAAVTGASLRAGITAELLRRLPSPGRDQPHLDALLMLAPATVQCFASFGGTWTRFAWGSGAPAETGGYPDSCYMWRRDGELGRRRGSSTG
jgi:Protein of unknown function (DUF2889)